MDHYKQGDDMTSNAKDMLLLVPDYHQLLAELSNRLAVNSTLIKSWSSWCT